MGSVIEFKIIVRHRHRRHPANQMVWRCFYHADIIFKLFGYVHTEWIIFKVRGVYLEGVRGGCKVREDERAVGTKVRNVLLARVQHNFSVNQKTVQIGPL